MHPSFRGIGSLTMPMELSFPFIAREHTMDSFGKIVGKCVPINFQGDPIETRTSYCSLDTHKHYVFVFWGFQNKWNLRSHCVKDLPSFDTTFSLKVVSSLDLF